MALPPALPFTEPYAQSITLTAAILPFFSTFTVIARFYARLRNKAGVGADDWAIIPALIGVYGETLILIFSERYGGAGHHIWDVPAANFEFLSKLTSASHFAFGISLGFAKISICLLLIRIFFTRPFQRTAMHSPFSRQCIPLNAVAWFVMAYCVCWTLMMIGIGAGLCRPFAYNWDKTIPGGKCGDQPVTFLAIAATDIIGDAMIIALPLPWVWSLNTTRKNKIGLSLIFALGLTDIIVAIMRIYYLRRIPFQPGADYTYETRNVYIWTALEPNLAVIVASGALLRPFFVDVYHVISSSLGLLTRGSTRGNTRASSRVNSVRGNTQTIPDDDGTYPLSINAKSLSTFTDQYTIETDDATSVGTAERRYDAV